MNGSEHALYSQGVSVAVTRDARQRAPHEEERDKMGEHDQANEWLTTREAMSILRIGRTRLWQLTREARLIAHQRGPNRKARYYARQDVEQLANEYRPVSSDANNTAGRENRRA
jgi:hypothetical protein